MVIAPYKKYIEKMTKLYHLETRKPKATPDIGYDMPAESPGLTEDEKHRFRSGMETLLYLLQDRPDLQHAVRHLSQWMSRPTRYPEEGLKHVILYLKGTPTYGVFLPYHVASNNSKMNEIHGHEGKCDGEEKLEVFTDSNWAGDKSGTGRRRHSVSSGMVFLDGRLVSSWSRTQKSIALSSCEAEYLAAVGGGSEGLFIGRLWQFLLNKMVKVSVITYSSSCRAFAQRLGVGKLKHVDVKYLWLQMKLKEGELHMESIGTTLNPADLGAKKLSKLRRAFLMYLVGMVEFDDSCGDYVAVGKEEFNQHVQRKYLGKNMKLVRQVMLETISDGVERVSKQISKPLVKALALLALQPTGASGVREIESIKLNQELMIRNFETVDLFLEKPTFMLVYCLIFFFVGVFVGWWFQQLHYYNKMEALVQWMMKRMRFSRTQFVDDWDPDVGCLRQYRVLSSPEDAESGEEFFMEDQEGLYRYIRPVRSFRERTGVQKADPNERFVLDSDDENEDDAMDVDTESTLTREQVSLPGDGEEEEEQPPPLPIVGANFEEFVDIYRYLPRRQVQRIKQIVEVELWSRRLLKEFCQMLLSESYRPQQPDMMWDYPLYWTGTERRGYTLFWL